MTSLRSSTYKGAYLLVGRQVASLLLKILGVFIITRLIGPGDYGAFVASFSVYSFIILLASFGIGTYLVRYAGDVGEIIPSAYATLAVSSFVLCGAMIFLTSAFAEYTGISSTKNILYILITAIPFQLLSIPAMSLLERDMKFLVVTKIEFFGQVIFYATSFALASLSLSAESLALSLLVQQIYQSTTVHIAVGKTPRFSFNRRLGSSMLKITFLYAVSNSIFVSRAFVTPLILAPLLGAKPVGVVGITNNLCETMSLMKGIAWRISMPVMARLKSDRSKLCAAVSEGIELLILCTGSILFAFSLAATVIVENVFGSKWEGLLLIYPYIAVAFLANTYFNLHSSVLMLLGKNPHVIIFNSAHVITLFIFSFALVSPLGIVGYGVAELCACVPYIILYFSVRKHVGQINYRCSMLWFIAVSIGLFWREIGAIAIAAPFLALATPLSVKTIRNMYVRISTKEH